VKLRARSVVNRLTVELCARSAVYIDCMLNFGSDQ